MHERANRHFIGELHSALNPEIKRVVVHGRSWVLGNWEVVFTDIIPGTETETYFGYHGDTRTSPMDESEHVTWGGDAFKIDKLPLVTHYGMKNPHPGVVTVGKASDQGKEHAVLWRYADQSENTQCSVIMSHAGYTDTSVFLGSKNSCRTCQKNVRKAIEGL